MPILAGMLSNPAGMQVTVLVMNAFASLLLLSLSSVTKADDCILYELHLVVVLTIASATA
jgi:hypothetical protein